jgi:hypothetical protein
VDNSRTQYQIVNPNLVNFVLEVASNNSFQPAERFLEPFDALENTLGKRFERWVANGGWQFNPTYTSTVIAHEYQPSSSLLKQSVFSMTDSLGQLKKSIMLVYKNYILDSPKLIEQNNALLLYPNPARQSCNVLCPAPGDGLVSIFGTNGQLVGKQTINESQNSLDLSALSAGLYQIRMELKGKQYQTRLVKQ